MSNKLVQQQLKNIIRGLNDHDLEKLLKNYEILTNAQIEKNCRMVSYKCYEASMGYKSWTTNGYGRTESEATNNCIKNFLEMVMEDEASLSALIRALKKGNDAGGYGSQGRENPEKGHNINNTLALNASYAQTHENNTSFDNKKDLEILSKNIGNLSMIGNQKVFGDTVNASQLEMDDILLKMILEEGNGPGPSNFRKNLPPQHPNGIDIGLKNHKGERASVGGSNANAEAEALRNKKILQDNTNIYGSTGNHTKGNEKEENRREHRQGGSTSPNQQKSKAITNSRTLEHKAHYYRNSSHDGHGESSQKEGYKEKEINNNGGTSKCTCNCAEQLQKANLRIESLQKKLKLLTEENKILKYLASESKEKEKEMKSEISTMTSLNIPSKSTYDKISGNYDLTPQHYYEDFNEFPEKDHNQGQNDKSRSLSLDNYAKRKAQAGSQRNINELYGP